LTTRLEVVLDCRDADGLSAFWCEALGYERFGSAGNYRSIVAPDGRGPKLILQTVDEPKTGKNRMHLDLIVSDIEAEASRLVGLGAMRISQAPVDEHDMQWLVMSDPENNEFCLCQQC
jgi:predicted enzyme related to lactoylglutathione lyase